MAFSMVTTVPPFSIPSTLTVSRLNSTSGGVSRIWAALRSILAMHMSSFGRAGVKIKCKFKVTTQTPSAKSQRRLGLML